MESNTLEIDSVIKKFDTKILLSDIYLKVKTGDIIGLLGRNGSGKSTLLKIIFGIEPCEHRFLRINDKVLISNQDIISKISYLDQQSYLPNNLRVNKVISLCIANDKQAEFCNDALIKQILTSKVSQLSGGELRYIEVKLLLFNNSQFVLLDEPFTGLSPINIELISDLIVKNALQKGILITDHNYNVILEICTQIYLLKGGKTHLIQNLSELEEKGYINISND